MEYHWFIYTVTMTSFAINLYGQCCRLAVVRQQVISESDISLA